MLRSPLRRLRLIPRPAFALLALCAACAPGGATPPNALPEPPAPELAAAAARQVEDVADRYVAAFFDHFPDAATSTGIPGADHGRLPDNSAAGIAAWEAVEDGLLAELAAVDPDDLVGTPAAITHGILREVLEAAVGYRWCREELWEVSPTWTGWQSDFADLASVQPVATAEERAQALGRARALPRFLDGEIVNLRRGLAGGWSAPRGNVERVVEQMDSLLAPEVDESPFYDPARRSDDDAFAAALADLVSGEIAAAIRRYRDFLAGEYLAAARSDIAVAANPDGAECYRAAVRYHTSLDLPAEEIHRRGLAEIERITAEMAAIGARSFGTSDVDDLLALVTEDPRYTFASREEILAVARGAVARAEAAVPGWFGLVPEAEVEVVPYPEFRERSAPGGEYKAASDDGSRPGTYYLNTYNPTAQSRAGVEATAFHESYPGHHLQISIAKERRASHPLQRYFGSSGFIEGWALYSERLAEEIGLYAGDVDRLGLLSNEALRAARLVVDSGMHRLGWSRQQAIDYLLAHTAESEDLVTAEVDRYIAVPGQATAYMLGNLVVRGLRQRAEARLGPRFDVRAFHDRVLEDGAVTLAMLEAKIERWTERTEREGG